MNLDYAKMYPTGGDPKTFKPGVKTIVQGASGTIDLADVIEDIVFVSMTAEASTAFNVANPQPGMTIIIEQNASANTDNHACTFTGITLNVAGNNVATTNADDEALIILMVSSTRAIIVANNGSVALS